jgi:hypothetical protein
MTRITKKVPIAYEFKNHDWWRMPPLWVAAAFAMIALGAGLNSVRDRVSAVP